MTPECRKNEVATITETRRKRMDEADRESKFELVESSPENPDE